MNNTQSTELVFELSRPGRRCHRLPASDVPVDTPVSRLVPAGHLAGGPPPLPEVSEIDLIRHFTNLSARNMSIDTNFYPLGSCTMKYNPKRHERLANVPGFANLHPLQHDDTIQGMLELLYGMQEYLSEISGLPAVSLQPAAGAQGELTALFVAHNYFKDKGEAHRTKILVPDSAHGTNPASAALAGFDAVTVKSGPDGLVDLNDLKAKLTPDVAVFMITNPNTLGLFETRIKEITDLLHSNGSLCYLDGANMNAILGVTRPGDFGADMQHYNVHKTFTGPHGGGGPGSGPIAVRDFLAPYLPAPVVVKDGDRFRLDHDVPKSHRPGAELLRQRRHPVPRVLLHPHARPGRVARRQRTRRAERELPPRAGRKGVRRAAPRPVHARVRRKLPGAAPREEDSGDGRVQAAARLRLPRADGVFPAGRIRGADGGADGNRE